MIENEIQNFNIMCGENLRNIMEQLTKDRGFSCISYHELRFTENGKTAIISKVEEFYYPHDYIAYYWAEFKKDGNDYRLTMFFKDFDHGTGNIHVLPGLFQLWIKSDKTNNCLDDYFWIKRGKQLLLSEVTEAVRLMFLIALIKAEGYIMKKMVR